MEFDAGTDSYVWRKKMNMELEGGGVGRRLNYNSRVNDFPKMVIETY